MKNYKLLSAFILVQIALAVISSCSNDNLPVTIQSSLIAYTNIDIIDGVSTSIQTKQTVVINKESGKIVDIFDSDSKTPESNVEIKNMLGKVIMPGLIEGHFHLASTVGEQTDSGKLSMGNMFKQGITTVRDMAGNGIALLELKRLGEAKETPYPKVYFAALVAGQDFIDNDSRVSDTAGSGTAGKEPWLVMLNDDTDVARLVQNAKKFGCSALKLYADISSDNAKRIIAEAKKNNFPVWSHGTLFSASPLDIIGVHSFSHSDLFNFVTISPVPTLSEFYDAKEVFDLSSIQSNEMQEYFDMLKKNNTILDATLSLYQKASSAEQDVVNFAHKATKSAYQKGVIIGAGVDKHNDDVRESGDFFLLKEMKLLKEVTGMSNLDALKAATINNAKAIGIDNEYGTIEIGKRADLIILNENPLDNLEKLKSISIVIKDGFEHNSN